MCYCTFCLSLKLEVDVSNRTDLVTSLHMDKSGICSWGHPPPKKITDVHYLDPASNFKECGHTISHSLNYCYLILQQNNKMTHSNQL